MILFLYCEAVRYLFFFKDIASRIGSSFATNRIGFWLTHSRSGLKERLVLSVIWKDIASLLRKFGTSRTLVVPQILRNDRLN